MIIKSVALLKYTCGHGEKCFGLSPEKVMDHHIVEYPKLVFHIVLFHYEEKCVDVEMICSEKSNAVYLQYSCRGACQ